MSATWGNMTVICQLHEADWSLSVSDMRQDDGYLSALKVLSLPIDDTCSHDTNNSTGSHRHMS